jgi:hypothetical protein
MICGHCEQNLPEGCRHLFGNDAECKVGPRTDVPWKIGKAIFDNLSERCGVGDELEGCDDAIKIEIIEAVGKIAIEVTTKEILR